MRWYARSSAVYTDTSDGPPSLVAVFELASEAGAAVKLHNDDEHNRRGPCKAKFRAAGGMAPCHNKEASFGLGHCNIPAHREQVRSKRP